MALIDLITLAIVIGAGAYLARRWFGKRSTSSTSSACSGCGPQTSSGTEQRISVQQLKAKLRAR